VTKAAFKQVEIERMLRAAKRVGYPAPAVEKRPDGSLHLLTVPPSSAAVASTGEDDLDAELEAWHRNRGDG
jgi:hypothetical protein